MLGRFCNPSVTTGAVAFLCILLLAAAPVLAAPARILFLGDSIAAGYGLDPEEGLVAQLEAALQARGHDVDILPGGVSGDTTAGGLSRLAWSLADKPDAVIVELGGNDGLRGVDPEVTGTNIRNIVRGIQKAGLPVLLTGMLAPPNLGRDYTTRFAAAFTDTAKETGVLFYPFVLDGVAGLPQFNQDDGIHPNQQGVDIIVERLTPYVEKLITQIGERSAR